MLASIYRKLLHNITSDDSASLPSREMPLLEFEGSQMEDLAPSNLSEQVEDLIFPARHQLTLGNLPSSLQMGPSQSVLVLTSLQSSGQIWHL